MHLRFHKSILNLENWFSNWKFLLIIYFQISRLEEENKELETGIRLLMKEAETRKVVLSRSMNCIIKL